MTEQPPLARTPQGMVPVPDPTILTTQALLREVAALRELVDIRYEALEDRMVNNFENFDVRMDLLNRERTGQFDSLEVLLTQRIDAMNEKIEQKFDLVERQRVEQKKDTKDAVDAALTAQKEAVKEQTTASERAIAKSETATNKQLEQQQVTVTTAVDALRRSIDELKERITEVDRNARQAISEVATTANSTVQQKVGSREDRTGMYAMVGFFATLIFVGIAVAGVLATRP